MKLKGLRVVDLSSFLPGPCLTMTLADHGAEVIKIENPAENGEVGRHVGPHFFGPGDSQFTAAKR